MALTLLGRIYQSSIAEDYDIENDIWSSTYSVAYLVRTTDECADESFIMSTPGLPVPGEISDIVPGSICNKRTATESSEGGLWTVVVEYVYKPGIEPWSQPPKYSFSTSRKQSLKTWMIYLGNFEDESIGDFNPTKFGWIPNTPEKRDSFGNLVIAVTNSVGEPIYYDGERILGIETKQVATRLPPKGEDGAGGIYDTYLKYIGTVNKSAETHHFFDGDPGTVLVDDISVEEAIWTDPTTGTKHEYHNITIRKIYDPLGHFVEFADIGSMYLPVDASPNNPADLVKITVAKDKDGNPTTVKLNGQGGRASDAGSGSEGRNWFLRYCPYPIADERTVIYEIE